MNRTFYAFLLLATSLAGLCLPSGFLNATIQGTPQQVSLVYIPKQGETTNFFKDIATGATAAQQAAAFDAYIDKDKYLSSRRGQFTERNGGRTPWNTQADWISLFQGFLCIPSPDAVRFEV